MLHEDRHFLQLEYLGLTAPVAVSFDSAAGGTAGECILSLEKTALGTSRTTGKVGGCRVLSHPANTLKTLLDLIWRSEYATTTSIMD